MSKGQVQSLSTKVKKQKPLHSENLPFEGIQIYKQTTLTNIYIYTKRTEKRQELVGLREDPQK